MYRQLNSRDEVTSRDVTARCADGCNRGSPGWRIQLSLGLVELEYRGVIGQRADVSARGQRSSTMKARPGPIPA